MSENNSFRSIAKANAIFGGVTFYNILISVAQSKVVAILLGPAGYGLMGLFNSTLDLIASLTNCGLQNSAIGIDNRCRWHNSYYYTSPIFK